MAAKANDAAAVCLHERAVKLNFPDCPPQCTSPREVQAAATAAAAAAAAAAACISPAMAMADYSPCSSLSSKEEAEDTESQVISEVSQVTSEDSHAVPLEEWIKAEFGDMEPLDAEYSFMNESVFCVDEFRTENVPMDASFYEWSLPMDVKLYESSLWCF